MEHSYVTIIEWPAGWDGARRILALAESLGQDPADAQLVARRPTPCLALKMAAPDAADGVGALRRRGVRACATPNEKIEGLPPPRMAKRLVEAGSGRYAVELWREPETSLDMANVFLMIRAGVRSERRSTEIRMTRTGNTGAFGEGPTPEVHRSHSIKTSEILDLYLVKGLSAARFRINGLKFNFDVLGPLKGYSDRENVEKLAMRFAAEAPRTLIDTGFEGFRYEAKRVRSETWGQGRTAISDAGPLFDFYSAWSFFIHLAIRDGA